jgi:fructokinase
VSFDDEGSTPVIVQHIRNKAGVPTHSFSRKCPCCGAILPWYKALRVADVTDLVPRLPKAQVCFLDRISRGAIALAKQATMQGAVVFFEPSSSSEPNLLEDALELAHIVKVSSDRIRGNEAVLTSTKPKIIIETQGSTGLRLRHTDSERGRGGNKWHEMSAIPVESLRDTAGAGDWCTAGIIHMLGAMGAKGLEDVTLTEVRQAVQIGQAMASWTCGFDGPRGGMYVTKRAAFQGTILGLVNGRTESAADMNKAALLTRERRVFTCESCRTKDKPLSPMRKSRR